MKLFASWRARRADARHAQALRHWALGRYDALAQQVLTLGAQPALASIDEFTRRFELLVLGVSVELFRLGRDGEGPSRRQALWDMTFEAFDASLRERGVTDIRIASRMGKLYKNATGRRNAYLTALEAADAAALEAAIARNVLGGADLHDPRIRLVQDAFGLEALPPTSPATETTETSI
ncbi:MAG: ubiquinol-cytochrome C chaperone family protein [Magnetococcus sp. WYHC-3]